MTPRNPILDARRRLVDLSGLPVPLAFFASAAALSIHHARPENSVETAFLGMLATVVLTSIACIERAPHPILGGISLTAAFALWALPAGGTRGAVVSTILVTGLGLAAWRTARRGELATRGGAWVALSIAGQALFEPEIWLAPTPDAAFAARAILFPALAGLAALELSQRRGMALLSGIALVVAVQRGFSPELALVLALWCALSLARERRPAALAWTAAALGVLAASASELGLLFDTARGWRDAAGALAWIPLLVPAALRPRSGRLRAALAALGLALVGSRLVPADVALIVPLLLLADCAPRAGAAERLQTAWTAIVVAAAAGAASYPWLRPRPVETGLALFGLEPGWRSAVLAVAVFWAIVLAAERLDRMVSKPGRRATWVTTAALLAVGVGLASNVWPSFRSLLAEPLVVSASEPVHRVPVGGSPGTAVVDSYVSNGVAVAPGTPLAELILEGAAGQRRILVLRAGLDTGEWAARRPGLEVAAPPAWISWPATDGRYFGQRYRAVEHFDAPFEVSSLNLTRSRGLPEELELAVLQIGVRP